MLRRPTRPTLFPTRRSSDLVWGKPDEGVGSVFHTLSSASNRPARARSLYRLKSTSSSWTSTPAIRNCSCNSRARSEEHTSELQSHSDLVCRLLLEKKKNITL